jgi:hypothetical protein
VNCYYCGRPATHLCKNCGRWLCDRGECGARAATEVLPGAPTMVRFAVRHPIRTARILPHLKRFI